MCEESAVPRNSKGVSPCTAKVKDFSKNVVELLDLENTWNTRKELVSKVAIRMVQTSVVDK